MLRKKIIRAAKQSLKSPEGKEALKYLKEVRSISDSVIDRFDIGYCPPNINHELRGRVITPIYDAYGYPVAISTRHMDKNRSNRFWHESFDKGLYSYGIYQAKEKIKKVNKVIIVEGEFDVLALHSYGFDMAVGCCGSVLTLFQVSLLSRYCNNFYILFDGDEAGRKSIERAKALYDKHSLDVYGLHFIPVYLPAGIDPDDFVNKVGRDGMKEKLKTSKEEYMFEIEGKIL